jgi:hypothetical protein
LVNLLLATRFLCFDRAAARVARKSYRLVNFCVASSISDRP